jgi:hypothetical protein
VWFSAFAFICLKTKEKTALRRLALATLRAFWGRCVCQFRHPRRRCVILINIPQRTVRVGRAAVWRVCERSDQLLARVGCLCGKASINIADVNSETPAKTRPP